MKTCSSEMHQFESADPVKHKTQSSVNLYCAKIYELASVKLNLNWIKFIATNKSSTMGSLICGVPDTIRWLLLFKLEKLLWTIQVLTFKFMAWNHQFSVQYGAFDQGFCYDFWSLFWLQRTVVYRLNCKAFSFGTFESFLAGLVRNQMHGACYSAQTAQN